MAWEITKDHISDDDDTRVGWMESHMRIPVEAVLLGYESPPLPECEKKVEFQLYDDDGELYYEGILDDDEDCDNQSAAQKWGEGDAGCTIIKVKRDGKWKQEIG